MFGAGAFDCTGPLTVVYETATHTTRDYRVGRLPARPVTVTVHRYEGGPGPTVYLQAAQHGIELNGPAALRRLHETLSSAPLAGTVLAVPVANPLALDSRSYLSPQAYDAQNPNLNRAWPGDSGGSLGERIAARLWRLVEDADAVVDLHAGLPDMLDHVRFRAGDGDARAMAEAFGATHALVDDGDRDDRTGTFRSTVAETGRPALTAELANSRRVDRSVAATGAEGVRNVLRSLDALDAPPSETPDPSLFRAAEPTRATESGLFELDPELAVGDRVAAGERVGVVHDPTTYERRQTVTAAASGTVYSLMRESTVVAGERLVGVAVAT